MKKEHSKNSIQFSSNARAADQIISGIRAKSDRKPVVIVQSDPSVQQMTEEISRFAAIAVDTEGDSFYRYYEKVCLIQVATAEKIYLVDPLSSIDVAPIKKLLENGKIEKVFHDAVYDVLLLKKTLSISPINIFDTQVAGFQLWKKQKGLEYLLEMYAGVIIPRKVKKSLRLADWGKRPLEEKLLDYAANDVRYLLEIKEQMTRGLKSLEEVKARCKIIEGKEPKKKIFNPEDYNKLPGANKLPNQKKSVLKRLFIWREEEAKKNDRPPFMIMQKDKLVELARRNIRTMEDIKPLLGKRKRNDQELCETIYSVIKGTNVVKEI